MDPHHPGAPHIGGLTFKGTRRIARMATKPFVSRKASPSAGNTASHTFPEFTQDIVQIQRIPERWASPVFAREGEQSRLFSATKHKRNKAQSPKIPAAVVGVNAPRDASQRLGKRFSRTVNQSRVRPRGANQSSPDLSRNSIPGTTFRQTVGEAGR